ncbi:hypothetical protein [Salinisphaera sp. T31B1]|uniref:PepSY domain-containing protein n=1 Tax=Salinisphaera sp. T31B1 TaxID=727963 RepID=UPI00333F39A1
MTFIGNSSPQPSNRAMHTRLSVPLWSVAAALGLALAAGVSHADDDDMEAARRALAAGEIRPFSTLLARIERDCDARFVEMELDRDDGLWIYEIKLLGPGGDVAELEYDARDLRLLEAEGHHLAKLRCVPAGTPD